METQLKYIELKSGYNNNGPAWIGMVEYSKTGRTIYFNGKAFKSLNGSGISGNYYDLETDDEYWVSGIKKDGNDRHWAGNGKILIDKNIVDDYLNLMDLTILDKSKFEPTEVKLTDKQKFYDLENDK